MKIEMKNVFYDLEIYTEAPKPQCFMPDNGFITCIGYTDENEKVKSIFCHSELGERELLYKFTNHLSRLITIGYVPCLVAHNNHGFDLKYLLYRCSVHGIKFPSFFISFDSRRFKNKDGRSSLKNLSKKWGLDGKYDDLDGSQAPQLWKNREFDKLRKYCEQDVKLLKQIYELEMGVDKK